MIKRVYYLVEVSIMKVYITVKRLSKPKEELGYVGYEVDGAPQNLRELITALVNATVKEYNAHVKNGDSPEPLSESEISRRALMGKIAFDIDYTGTLVDGDKAVRAALSAYEDGLFRVFMGDNELTELSSAVSLSETFTFIRLTMLTGRLW